MNHNNLPIGIFDSGIGGLTVASAIRNKLPSEDIIYLGDTARVPYGDKSPETIIRFGIENSSFLLKFDVKLIAVACNTVSALALRELRNQFPDIPIWGVLEAGVSKCIEGKPKSVAVIGTRATVNSDAYRREIQRYDSSISVKSIACPLLVPLAEEGLADHKISKLALDLYLRPLLSDLPDALLLACTHYPVLKDSLSSYFNGKIRIIDSAMACADFVAEYMREKKITANPASKGTERFYVTDMSQGFYDQAARFFGCSLENVQKIKLT